MNSLFAYGTLMAREVSDKIIDIFSEEKAILKNYRRFSIFHKNIRLYFPAIIPENNFAIEGILFRNLSKEQLQKLDQFESELYERKKVNIDTSKGQEKAWTYVWKPSAQFILNGNWCFENFKTNEMHRFNNEEL